MAFPSPTKTYHTDTYPAIDPTLPELSTKGKNIIITGGGIGIGQGIATAFAKSGASHVALLGRREGMLLSSKKQIETEYPDTQVNTYNADITERDALEQALSSFAHDFGPIDVLVANAGYAGPLQHIAESSIEEWYASFDINVKGNFNLVHAFLSHAAEDAAVLHISTAIAHLPYMDGFSSYDASKLASAKLFDYVHRENPKLFVLNIHPGVIRTAMNEKDIERGDFPLPLDDGQSYPSRLDKLRRC